jgi:4-hydroxy-tetrahydrodipicolinate reductase
MLDIFVFGLSGRMGQEVKKITEDNPALRLVGGTSRSQPTQPSVTPHLVIDFSLPESLDSLVQLIHEHKAPLVSGTTGLTPDQKAMLKQLGNEVPVFWSANMSFGVYLMCQLTEMLARYDGMYHYQIEETHHIHKKDKPSGTAIMIEQAAGKSTQKLKPTISLREGEVFGEHRFIARSDNELLEIRHEALSRSLFAQGAVDIGRWLVKQRPGYYEMSDFFASVGQNA